jgi:hypothetical protein
MLPQYTHLRIIVNCKRYAFPLVLVWVMTLQLLNASDRWSRVTRLKQDTWIYVILEDGNSRDGRLVNADASTLVISSGSLGTVELKRNSIVSIAIDHKRRHWYAIPLAVIVGATAGFTGYEIASHSICSGTQSDSCKNAKVGSLIGVLAGAAAGATYRVSRGGFSRKIIYHRP